ncbi:MAG: cupin domain-containing protein [Comamonadaceae bacterium]|nr:MAG: cupin domain-containing protein [Comamonadaceae bacterium]
MDSRAQEIVTTLKLKPHPEGGWFREIFRSASSVLPADGRPVRSALTTIYFLLEYGHHSRWHRVLSDEAWVYLEGAALDLWEWDADSNVAACTTIGPINFDTDIQAQHVVKAGIWQAARPKLVPSQAFTLVTCTVGPGFDFDDFALMKRAGAEATVIHRDWPELSGLI